MDLSRPYSALAPSRDLDVLKVLAGTTRPMSGRHVARVSGIAPSSVRVALERLVKHGLVTRESVANASMFMLNREHLAAPAVDCLADMWPELLGRLREVFKRWDPPPVHASLFGSAARRDGGAASDIDLFLLRDKGVDDDTPAWRGQVEALEEAIFAWTGNRAAIVEVADDEAWRDARAASPLVRTLRRDAIDLAGKPADEVLGRS